MGKFETTKRSTDTQISILPNIASYRGQTIGTFYTDAQNLQIANSHMAKNSEWGAMAYLTDSKYGRNGTPVTKNNCSWGFKTGQGDYKTNTDQSTTGNIYGIYDTSGGAYEYVAAYMPSESTEGANSFASTDNTNNNKTESTEYATVYSKDNPKANYSECFNSTINNVFGDALAETTTKPTGTFAWHSSNFSFIGKYGDQFQPILSRGDWWSQTYAGTYSAYRSSGGGGTYSFRTCFIVK